ncbi:uncharacterized protein LOC126771207 [Nymphalis io]|uniref:uncharacterized protein LOC126771207 n=1 Tax=Inachis io TaxID=171585 RepID=UPI002168F80B|nr:uncharacterized protein LOC126771207 [Nymphalis io]
MFYPVESLKRGGRFYLCWVADSWPLRFATITHRQLWSQDIRQICDDLLEVMKNESGRPKNRFSLRLSSQLMRGLVRLYQRKVTVFVGDLCMINALVMKSTNKKVMPETTAHESITIIQRPDLPRLIFEEQVDDDKIEERIGNSGNIVANVQDITLKEPILPENRLHLDDGFGELHPDQPLQVLADRTLETMMVQDASATIHSGLDLHDVSTDKSHDKSRRMPHESLQMEQISEHDLSIFRKSVGEELIVGADFDKDIPEIPEIPPPDLPAPEIENQQGRPLRAKESLLPSTREVTENVNEKSLEEFVLEYRLRTVKPVTHIPVAVTELYRVLELEEEPRIKRRKLKNKLIVDKNIKLSSNFIRSRIENINVDLRCEDGIGDIISIYATPSILLNRPAHCGSSLHSNLGYQLSYMFSRNLGAVQRQPVDQDIEEVIAQRTRQSNMRSTLEIDEVIEPADKRIQSIHHEFDVPKEIDITDPNLVQDEIAPIAPGQELMDISDLPTQRLLTTSQAQKRTSDNDPSPKRQRRGGYVSYRLSQQTELEAYNAEVNKENIPENRQQDAERITAMLVEAGLADIQEHSLVLPTDVEPTIPAILTQKSRRNGSETSETPLGSLDRTKVSLGDSEKTTDSKRFIREEWGTQGTMHKIYKCIRKGVKPLDLHCLVTKGPTISGHRRVIAARCFTSMLKLKQHGFIRIVKDPNTYEIKDIALGSKIISNKRQDD